jgi:hypothetical protein
LGFNQVHRIEHLIFKLLKLYSSDISEADLLHIKRYLAKYFAFKAIGEADQIWDESGWGRCTEFSTAWFGDEWCQK